MTELDSELESYYNIRSDIKLLPHDKVNNNIESSLDIEGINPIVTHSNSRLIIAPDSSSIDELILSRYPYYTMFIALTNCK